MRTTTVLLVLMLGAAGCGGPSAAEVAATQAAAKKKAQQDLDKAPIWIGRVTGHEGIYGDKVVIEYGGRYPAQVRLAHVDPLHDCDISDEDYDDQYTAAIQHGAPVGATVAVVRSLRKDGRFEVEKKGFVHPVAPDGTANLSVPSLNERLTRNGVAQPDPRVVLRPEEYEDDLEESIDSAREHLSDLNFKYWRKIVAGYVQADKKRRGPAGKCAAYEVREQLREQEREREAEEDRRRYERQSRKWRLGPDGREGTDDDYSHENTRDSGTGGGGSSGGGGFNVPGRLCPTRFC